MSVNGQFTPPVASALPSADFWRSGSAPTSAGSLPDGVNDIIDSISRQGLVGIGQMFGPAASAGGVQQPVANLDISGSGTGTGRTGTDARNVNDVAFFTGNIQNVFSCPPVTGVPPQNLVAGLKVMHFNQTQGIGIFYDGIRALGNSGAADGGNQNFAFQQRGNGIFAFQWETLNGNYNYFDRYGNTVLGVNQGFNERWFGGGCNNVWNELRQFDTAGNMQMFFQGQLNGGNNNLLRIRPYYDCGGTVTARGSELYLDENRVGAGTAVGFKGSTGVAGGNLANRKIVLFDGNRASTEQFFGFGINGATLRYQIPSGSFHRFYASTGVCTSQEVFAVDSNGNTIIDPSGVNFDGGFRNGILRFGDEGSTTFIAAAAQNPQQLVGGTPAPFGVAPFADPGRLTFGTTGAVRMHIKANGIVNITPSGVLTFATDALAGAGGLVAGDIFKDSLGVLHIKL